MALLIRCRKCNRFFSPDNQECPGCEKPWDVRGSPKAFYVDFTWLGKRRRIRLKAKNLHYAKVQEAEFRPEKWWEERKQFKVEEKRIRFRDAVQDYLFWCEHEGGKRGQNRKATLRSKTTTFANYLIPFFGPKYIDEIQPEDITRFKIEATNISGPRKIKRTPQSINLDLRYLKNFFNWAIDRGYCHINPVTKVSFLEETGNSGPPPKFTRDEMREIEKALYDPRFPLTVKNLIRAWKGLGLRAWNETAKLRWEWFHEEDGIIVIPAGFSKTKKPLVKVLSDEMWGFFRLLKEGRNDSPWIFPNPQTGKPYTNLRGSLRRLCKMAEIERQISPKTFRHNFLSHGASEGIPDGQLKDTVGHSNTSTTERYIHWFTQERRSIENRIARRLSPPDVEQNVEHRSFHTKKATPKSG